MRELVNRLTIQSDRYFNMKNTQQEIQSFSFSRIGQIILFNTLRPTPLFLSLKNQKRDEQTS